MTKQEYLDKAKNYRLTNPEYAGILTHIFMFCQEDFLPLFEQAESENKQLYLIETTPLDKDADVEPIIELKDIGIR